MTRFYVPLTQDEFVKLAKLASKEMRNPRDQARYILRSVLLGDQAQENKNPSTATLPERTANGFGVSQPCSVQAKEVNL